MPTDRLEDIAYVRFSAPDLGVMHAFLEEFGFTCYVHADGCLYARGRDGSPFLHVTEPGEPAFRGFGLRTTGDALERLAAREGGRIEANAAPGGGRVLRLADPDGHRIEVIAGQPLEAPEPPVPGAPFNTSAQRLRVGRRPPEAPRPSHVLRLGHIGLGVTNLRRSEHWYKERFGLLTSDEIELKPGEVTGAFLRCDHGARPVDHHTVVMAQFKKPRFLHAAFEVPDVDDLMLGHAFLESRQRTHVWGVGRHILGSQVFDYWQDPFGHELEHWTDGDLLTATEPPGLSSLAQSLASQWGSSHPGMSPPRGERS